MSQIALQQAALLEDLMLIMRHLDQLPHKNRSAFISNRAKHMNISNATLYRWLKQKCGRNTGRKKRTDAGTTSVSDKDIVMIGAMQKATIRKNGKLMLSTPTAMGIANQNGADIKASASTVNRALKNRQFSANLQGAITPHIHMRSLHPNHVHQVDPSLCVLYYIKGKQHMMEADKFYKNKVDNYAKVKLKIWRYVLVDHYSSFIFTWYVEAAGENPENLFEFLMLAWGKKTNCDFHGVPLMMIWDKGSANTASSIQNLVNSLDTEHVTHKKGVARAKGSVEGGNNIVERQFESRLKFCPVDSVEQLNQAVINWINTYNSNRIPGQDTRLRRKGLSTPIARSDLWHRITALQLRLLPDVSICRDFMIGKAEKRQTKGDMTISYKHPKLSQSRQYDLTKCRDVNVNDWVEVCPMIYGDGLITITVVFADKENSQYKLEPVADYDEGGFRHSNATYGEEYKRKAKTNREKAGDQLDIAAYGSLSEKDMDKAKDKAVPFAGLDSFEHLKHIELPTYLPRQGSEIKTGQRFEEKPMSSIAAAKILKLELGERYTPFHLNYVKQNFPNGITSTELEALVLQFNQSNVSPIKGVNNA